VTAREIFEGSDAAKTKAYYARLTAQGPYGIIAAFLMRAQKASTRAKKYHGISPLWSKGHRVSYRDLAYERKGISLQQLNDALEDHEKTVNIPFGWKEDPKQPYARWVLYVDLPQGQVSFHNTMPYSARIYPRDWDRQHASAERIFAFCEAVMLMPITHRQANALSGLEAAIDQPTFNWSPNPDTA
jgi:hypothetical protein